MTTINTIIEELKHVPEDRLDDLYVMIQSLQLGAKSTDEHRKEILSFAGAFADMKEDEYSDFYNYTQQTRAELFDRDTKI